MEAAAARVDQQEPALAARLCAPLHAHVGAQPRLQRGRVVPQGAVEGLVHGSVLCTWRGAQPTQRQVFRRSQAITSRDHTAIGLAGA